MEFVQSYACGYSLLKRFIVIAAVFTMLLGGFMLPAKAIAEETATVTAQVVLRKSADTDSKALQTLAQGEEVVLLSSTDNWYKVNYGKYTGYIMKKYIKTQANSVVKNGDKIKALGAPPGSMRIGDENDDVEKLQQALKILGHYDNRVDGVYGDGTTAAVMQYQKGHNLEADGIAGKATVASIFGSCAKTSKTKANTAATPAPASTSSGSSKSGASKGETVGSIAEIGAAPSATCEGDSGSDVVKLQQALECLGYYSGEIDGSYGSGTVSAVKKLQKNRNMNEDGIAGSATLRVLFGSSANAGAVSAKGYQTEVLDWFADDVSSIIPKNAKFTVKDVRTGKTFEAVRWSGVNHLDVEPRTSEDTAALKEIYGGSWSWSRRPILILYNGHVYAASMNGMPHGTTTINNNFDGHICIHFKNSKTHGTKKVDADHQNAVTSAGRASW